MVVCSIVCECARHIRDCQPRQGSGVHAFVANTNRVLNSDVEWDASIAVLHPGLQRFNHHVRMSARKALPPKYAIDKHAPNSATLKDARPIGVHAELRHDSQTRLYASALLHMVYIKRLTK